MNLFMERLPRSLVLHSKGRILMTVVIIVSLGLQWFCWAHRSPIVRQRYQEIRAVERLEDEVKRLEKRWSEEDVTAVETRLEKARKHLFHGDPMPGTWSEEVNRPKSMTSMAASVTHGEPIPHPRHADSLLIVPTVWDLDIGKAGHQDFPAILRFLKALTTDQNKRMDLVRLTAIGDGRNLSRVELGLDLWFLKEIEDIP